MVCGSVSPLKLSVADGKIYRYSDAYLSENHVQIKNFLQS